MDLDVKNSMAIPYISVTGQRLELELDPGYQGKCRKLTYETETPLTHY